MSGGAKARSARRLTGEERALWRMATRAVKPLRGRADGGEREPESAAGAAPAPAAPAAAPAQPPGRTISPPPLAPLGRRLKQQAGRGGAALDARLDLHGMTQERAHTALLRFLHAVQADGAKLVLVITGKGARAGADGIGERGVLRRLVPHWLALPEFRAYVIGFAPAHTAHGGEGALYVRVRRRR